EIASPIGIPSREESQQDEIFRKTISLNHRAKNLTHQLTAGVAIEHQQYTAPQQDILSGITARRYHFRYQGAMQVNSSLLVSTRLQHDKSEGTIDNEIRRGIQENGLFLGVEQSLSDHTLFNGGMRVEMLNNQLNPMTASFGVEHRPWDSDFIKVRASASKNFRNPTLNDLYWPALGNPDLLAEEGNSVEGGVHFFPKEIKISLVYFQNYLTDQIVWTPNDEGVFRPQNLNRARNRGIESRIDIRSKVIKKFQLAYTYTDSEVKRIESNAYVRSLYQPEHLLNVSAWDNRGPFEIGCSMSFSSEVWTDYALSTSSILGHVLLIDTHINWSPNSDDDRFTVGLSMRNLMDKNYEYVKDRQIPGRYMQLNFKMYLYETN
ncbi:MAG: TonB-dependent receptor, partial [Flavobacteriales bacterium]|nr:TonB-dependent receptor [Flavobacteriales bacterium]